MPTVDPHHPAYEICQPLHIRLDLQINCWDPRRQTTALGLELGLVIFRVERAVLIDCGVSYYMRYVVLDSGLTAEQSRLA